MIVAWDTASTDISVAVAAPDGAPLASATWTSDRRQGHELLPRLLELLAGQRRGLADVTAVAVGIGPGSFTGLRVGMGLAKGLALARELPIVGAPSLRAWLDAEPEALAAIGRAGAREAYLLLRGEAEPSIVDRDALPAATPTAVVVAPGELAAAFGLGGARGPGGAAGAVAAVAARRLADDGSGDDLERLEPAYLRAPRGIGQVPHAEVP